jgi:hypothetical protein
MIQRISCHVVWAHQGGCCMSLPFSPDQEQSTLALVWAHLSSDLQTRVIGLLAQLALNVVVARSPNQSKEEEARHVEPAPDPQNPS